MNRLLVMLLLLCFMTCIGLYFSIYANGKTYDLMDKNIIYQNDNFTNNKQIIDSLFKEEYFKDLLRNGKLFEIEDELKKIKSIKDINIYLNNNSEFELSFVDRTAIAFLSESNHFIDNNGVVFMKKFNSNELLTEIDGTLSDIEISRSIKFLLTFNEDNFFENKIKKIWFKNDDLYMQIKNLDFKIRLGNTKNIRNKLKMLKGFYAYQSKILSKKKYKQVDLVYKNQLVAIKK